MKVLERHVANLRLLEVPGEPEGGVIMLLHGYGADAEDLLPLSSLSPASTWLFPEGPHTIAIAPGYEGKAWFPISLQLLQHGIDAVEKAFPKDLLSIREDVTELIEELKIPLPKLMIGGFSQGAVLALETALYLPERLRGLLLFSGTLIAEERWKKAAQHLSGTSFFQSHGRDDPILPFTRAEALERLLTASGWKGKLHAFSGGHTIPDSLLPQVRHFLTTHLEKQ